MQTRILVFLIFSILNNLSNSQNNSKNAVKSNLKSKNAGKNNPSSENAVKNNTVDYLNEDFNDDEDLNIYNWTQNAPTVTLPDFLLLESVEKVDCINKTCFQKCCPKDQLYDDAVGCSDVKEYNTSDWFPTFVGYDNAEVVTGFANVPDNYSEKELHCLIRESNEFTIQRDGSVYYYEGRRGSVVLPRPLYCIDKTSSKGRVSTMGALCLEMIGLTNFEKTMSEVHFYLLCISTAFLGMLLIFQILSSSRKDLQAKCTLSSCICLFIGFILLILQSTSYVSNITHSNCVAIGLATQYFFLGFDFWLNLMCFEINRIISSCETVLGIVFSENLIPQVYNKILWYFLLLLNVIIKPASMRGRRFWGTTKMKTYQDMTSSKWRFFYYCLYGWGAPLIVTCVTLGMQNLPDNLGAMENYIIRPHIGEGRCWFRELGGSVYAYFYGISVFLHALNAFFMVNACVLLRRQNAFLTCLQKQSKGNDDLRIHVKKDHLEIFQQRLAIFSLYLMIWILNCVSLIASYSQFWLITDCFVRSQGIFVFFLVIWPKKFGLVQDAYRKMSLVASDIKGHFSSNSYQVSESTNK